MHEGALARLKFQVTYKPVQNRHVAILILGNIQELSRVDVTKLIQRGKMARFMKTIRNSFMRHVETKSQGNKEYTARLEDDDDEPQSDGEEELDWKAPAALMREAQSMRGKRRDHMDEGEEQKKKALLEGAHQSRLRLAGEFLNWLEENFIVMEPDPDGLGFENLWSTRGFVKLFSLRPGQEFKRVHVVVDLQTQECVWAPDVIHVRTQKIPAGPLPNEWIIRDGKVDDKTHDSLMRQAVYKEIADHSEDEEDDFYV